MLGTNIYFTNQPIINGFNPLCGINNSSIQLEGIEYEVRELKQDVEFWHQSPSNDHAAIEFFKD